MERNETIQYTNIKLNPGISFKAPESGYVKVIASLKSDNGHWHIKGHINGIEKKYFMLLHPKFRRSIDIRPDIAGEFFLEVKKGDDILISAGSNPGDILENQLYFSALFHAYQSDILVNKRALIEAACTGDSTVTIKINPNTPFIAPESGCIKVSASLKGDYGHWHVIGKINDVEVEKARFMLLHPKHRRSIDIGAEIAGEFALEVKEGDKVIIFAGSNPDDILEDQLNFSALFQLSPSVKLVNKQLKALTETNPKIENLVFQGGGVKGVAYLGALETLLDRKIIFIDDIKRVCGASAGAITALFLALGKDFDELSSLIKGLDFKILLDEGNPSDDSLLSKRETIFKFIDLYTVNNPSLEDIIIYLVVEFLKIFSSDWFDKKKKGLMNKEELKQEIKDFLNSNSYFRSIIGGLINFSKQFTNQIFSPFYTFLENTLDYLIDKVVEAFFGIRLNAIKKSLLSNYFNNDKEKLAQFVNSMHEIIVNLVTEEKPGIFSGEALLRWIGDQIENAGFDRNITFAELHQEIINNRKSNLKELHVVALNLTNGLTEIFSHIHNSNVPIIDAVRVSMSIPYFFQPHTIRKKQNQHLIEVKDNLYTDGGVHDNYPIWVFDNKFFTRPDKMHEFSHSNFKRNKKTLGFKLVTAEDKELFEQMYPKSDKDVHPNCGILKYTKSFATTLMNKQKSDHYHSGDNFRTVYINTVGILTVEFNLSQDKKEMLINSGKEGAADYCQKTISSSDPLLNSKLISQFSSIYSQQYAANNSDVESVQKTLSMTQLNEQSPSNKENFKK